MATRLRMVSSFKQKLEKHFKIEDHPRKNLVWNMAWGRTWHRGWMATFQEYKKIVGVLR